MNARTYMLVVVALTATAAVFAQSDQWRDEDIGMPSVTALRCVDGVFLASTYKGLYQWDAETSSWRYTNLKSREIELRAAAEQPGGILTQRTNLGVRRYDVHTGQFELRPLNYSIEANDSVLGEITYAGTNPNAVRVTWYAWPSQDVLQVDDHQLPDQFQGNGYQCADGSLLFFAQDRIISFKYGRTSIDVEYPNDDEFDGPRLHLESGRTNIVMQNQYRVVASSDHGLTWRTIRSGRTNRYHQIRPTDRPDVFYAIDRSGIHLRLTTTSEDTLSPRVIVTQETNAAGKDGWLVLSSIGAHLCQADQTILQPVNIGLPSGGLWNTHMLADGIVARNNAGVLIRPSGDSWSRLIDNTSTFVLTLNGGTSLDDIWLSYATGFEQASFARIDRNGGISCKRPVSMVNMHGGTFWDRFDADTLFCVAGDESLYLVEENGRHRKVHDHVESPVLITFHGGGVAAVSGNGNVWFASGDLRSWRRSSIPRVQSVSDFFERGYSVNGQYAVVRGVDSALITYDQGSTWTIEPIPLGSAVTIGSSGITYRAHYDRLTRRYRFSMNISSQSVELPFLLTDSVEFSQVPLREIVVDENERRLFAVTGWWVRSISLPAISTVDDVSDRPEEHASGHERIYDVHGRLIGVDLDHTSVPYGVYLLVTDGKAKCTFLGVP